MTLAAIVPAGWWVAEDTFVATDAGRWQWLAVTGDRVARAEGEPEMAQARCERCSREAGAGHEVYHVCETQAEADRKVRDCGNGVAAVVAGGLPAIARANLARAARVGSAGAGPGFPSGAATGESAEAALRRARSST